MVQQLVHSQLDSQVHFFAADDGWDQNAQGIVFNSSGKTKLRNCKGGLNYGGKTDLTTTGALILD